jgi:biotin-dependent carboxylase-like uncharacterized protein
MIAVERIAGLVTVQDAGRRGHRSIGVSPGGPLDAGSLVVANAMVGNDPRAAVLEGCLASATLRFDATVTFVLTGAAIDATLDDRPIGGCDVQQAGRGSVLRIAGIARGAVWYLGVRGGIMTPIVLGSRSTLVRAGLGAPLVKRETELALDDAERTPVLAGPVPALLRTPLDDAPIEWLPGTRLDAVDAGSWQRFFLQAWAISPTSDRTGYRLDGEPLRVVAEADRASEPTCAGAMQLPPDGRPIVLMAEHPTIGGYPVIGVVPPHALDALAQRPPGARVTFVPTTPDEVHAVRRARRDALRNWIGSA